MAHPESIIAPDGTAAQTRLLLRATESLNAAVAALQEATNLLEEKARQLHTHEAVMADRDHAGHFVPGVGFTYDPETRRHNIDALSGVEELTSELAATVATDTATVVAETTANTVAATKAAAVATETAASVAANTASTVATETATTVAAAKAVSVTTSEVTRMFAERDSAAVPAATLRSPAGSRPGAILPNTNWQVPQYVAGENTLEVFLDGIPCFAGTQYREIGDKGTKSTVIQWIFNIPVNYDIDVRVI